MLKVANSVISASRITGVLPVLNGGTGVTTSTGTTNVVLSNSPTLVTPSLGTATFAAGAVGTPAITTTGDSNTGIYFPAADELATTVGGAEATRIDASKNLLVGVTSGSNHVVYRNAAPASRIISLIGENGGSYLSIAFSTASSQAWNGANTVQEIGSNAGTGRSINAAGTVNAAGLDYAEYMTKTGKFTIAKGDVVGIDAQGKLTNVFANAISFVVKSTNPSYVGGDSWGVGFEDDAEGLEVARQLVDRIAFAGQVPVNVMGATPGQYIIPINNNGAIKAKTVSNPTFEQYQISVGKVIAIESDGRAKIIVKVA